MGFRETVKNRVYGRVRVGNVTMVDGQDAPILLDANGRQRVAVDSIPTHPVTGSGTFSTAPAAPTTVNGVGAASNNAANQSTTACALTECSIFNNTAAKVFVKYYNKATAPVPATGTGSDAPVVVIPVEAGQFVEVNFGTQGKRFSAGLGIAIVGGPAQNDNTAVAAGVVHSTTRI